MSLRIVIWRVLLLVVVFCEVPLLWLLDCTLLVEVVDVDDTTDSWAVGGIVPCSEEALPSRVSLEMDVLGVLISFFRGLLSLKTAEVLAFEHDIGSIRITYIQVHGILACY